MPKGKGKAIRESLDTSADISDNEPNEWSDDEETSSNSGSNHEIGQNVDVLKELIQHGFEVKGKLIDGKLSYLFRSPKTQEVKGSVEQKQVRVQPHPTYVGGGAIHYHEPGVPSYEAPPGYYQSSTSIPDNRSVEKEKKKRHSAKGWVRYPSG